MRLTLAVALVVILLSCLFGALLIRSHHRFSIHQIELNALMVGDTIMNTTKHAMLANQPEHVHEIVDEIGYQNGIGEVRIFNKVGRVVYSPSKESIGQIVDQSDVVCLGCHFDDSPLQHLPAHHRTRTFEEPGRGPYLGVTNPIYNAPTCAVTGCHPPFAEQAVLGVLDVTFSLEETQAHLRDNLKFAFGLLIGSIIGIAVVIWISLRYLLGRPVNSLLQATKAVAEGDLTYRVRIEQKDELGQLAGSFNGMTESLQDAKVQIYRSNKLASLGRLAAGVAHEINNPLTGVLSFSSFLLKRSEEGSEDREDLETIVSETKRCRTIVRGLLDFSRQVQPKKTRACFNTAARRALEIVKNQLTVNRVDVQSELLDDLPEVMADSDQLVQLVLNLVVNASDAMGDQQDSAITVATQLAIEKNQHFAEMTVTDNGPGIPDENIEKIFDPFFSTKGNSGTGLGLSVVWGIVDEHGGTITVHSEINVGTTFVIRIPVYEATPIVKGGGDS